jgi:hypothetical protein
LLHIWRRPGPTFWRPPATPRNCGGRSGATISTNALTGRSDGAPRRRQLSDRGSIIRLVGAVLAQQHDEWAEGRRYLDLDILARSRLTKINNDTPERESMTAAEQNRVQQRIAQ